MTSPSSWRYFGLGSWYNFYVVKISHFQVLLFFLMSGTDKTLLYLTFRTMMGSHMRKTESASQVVYYYNLSYSEAEIRRIMVCRRPRQIVLWNPIMKKPITKKDWWSGSRCSSWVQTLVPKKKKTKTKESISNVEWINEWFLYFHFDLLLFNFKNGPR
jgi:hypothetical protein